MRPNQSINRVQSIKTQSNRPNQLVTLDQLARAAGQNSSDYQVSWQEHQVDRLSGRSGQNLSRSGQSIGKADHNNQAEQILSLQGTRSRSNPHHYHQGTRPLVSQGVAQTPSPTPHLHHLLLKDTLRTNGRFSGNMAASNWFKSSPSGWDCTPSCARATRAGISGPICRWAAGDRRFGLDPGMVGVCNETNSNQSNARRGNNSLGIPPRCY
jgi:hypothetical protein